MSAGLLLAALFLTNVVEGRSRAPATSKAQASAEESFGTENAFAMVVRHRYLLLIALLMLLLNWVNTTGEYILGRTIEDFAAVAAVKAAAVAPAGSAAGAS